MPVLRATITDNFSTLGFMYSLIGLYDLWKTLKLESVELDPLTLDADPVSLSESLFHEGVASYVFLIWIRTYFLVII